MIFCADCKIESESPKGWYADLTDKGKIMRCPSCGKKEADRRYENLYGEKKFIPTEEVDKQDRIQHAKNLRESGLSPWKYQKV